jgi:hypothetical protein
MALHESLTLGDIHIVYNWTYADATARLAATGFTAADTGKLARQLDDDSLWLLSTYSPIVWVAVSGANDLTQSSHKILRQLIHFINEGPAEGFTTGAYKVVTGTAFPTSIVWYNNNSPTKKKIVEKLITWTGANPTTIVWKVYDATETLLATVTDTVSYSGPFETSRSRAIA